MIQWFVLAMLSAVFDAFANIIRKHVLNHEHPLEQLAAEAPLRVLVLCFLIPFIGLLSPVHMLATFGVAIVLATTLVLKNRAYRHLPISTVAPLQNFSPIFLVVLAALLLGERPSTGQLFGILLVAGGGYVLELNTDDPLRPFRSLAKHKYTPMIILVLVLLSTLAVLDKTMLGAVGVEPLSYLFWLYLFVSALSLGADLFFYRLKGVAQDLRKGWYWLLLMTISTTAGILLIFQAYAIPGVLVSLAIPIRRTATFIETMLGGHLFHEGSLWRKATGCAIMLLGIVFIV